MRVSVFMHWILILFLGLQYTQVAHNWILHQQPEVGYNFLGPEKMEHRSKQLELTQGITEFHTYFAVGNDGDSDMVFSLSHYRNPTPEDLLDDALNSAVEAILESTGGSLDYRTAFTKDGRPGILWRISHPGEKVRTKGRVIYHNDHYLIIQVTFPSGKSLNAKIDAFTESLRLTF